MPNELHCPNGHLWEMSLDGNFTEELAAMVCPICGAACDAPSPRSEKVALSSPELTRVENREVDSEEHLPRIPGYQVIGVLGVGGMGQVFKAKDLRLDRLVALKTVSRDHASPEMRLRFRVEGKALAKLDHPNIVKIYDVDEHLGSPYFSFEYLEGGSLDHKLAGNPQTPQTSARLIETLARAIHWAHQKGIVHRDLKPANILLTLDGQPKITDFGLAKRLEDDSFQTRTGDILGTPAYMAPEQSTGDAALVGPPADVYALGVILYEMLTGRPPFRGVNTLETLQLIRSAEPVPPNRLRPGVPRDLETICLKCLEKVPARRYASGEELAEDLNRFLTHQSIRASRTTLPVRVTRWMWRKPELAALVVVINIAVLAFALLAAWSFVRLRDLASRADNRSRIARSVVDDLYSQFAEEWLAEEPYRDPIRQDFLEKAVRLYQEFAKESPFDPTLQQETAQAHYRLGQIYRILNRNAEAQSAYGQAISIQRRIARESSANQSYRQDLGNSYASIGELFRQTEELDAAESNYRKAIELQIVLVTETPTNSTFKSELARSHYNLAIALVDTGRPEESELHLAKAIELLGQLHEAFPTKADFRHELARCFINRGVMNKDKNAIELAEADYRRAIELLRPLTTTTRMTSSESYATNRVVFRADLAVAYRNLGNLWLGQGKLDEALTEMARAAEILSLLVSDFPQRPAYQQRLADTYNSLAGVHAQKRKLDDAEKNYDMAKSLQQRLVKEHDDVMEYRQQLGITLGNLAWLRSENADWQDARALYQQSIECLREAYQRNPHNATCIRGLCNQFQSLAETNIRLGDHAAAVSAAKTMIDFAEDRAQVCYFAACFLSRCSALAKMKSSFEGHSSLADEYAEQAIAFLRKASDAGDVRRLSNEQEIFQPISDRQPFQDALAALDRRPKS